MKALPPPHPAEFSPEVLAVVAPFIVLGARVHDPFAGRGLRLGALCDRLGAEFSGTDIDRYQGVDKRVVCGDSRDGATYPTRPFTVVTSPVYLNRMSTDYLEGPLPTTKLGGRRSYGVCLGRALHLSNLARRCRSAESYYAGHAEVVRHWDCFALVNVDSPMLEGWAELLVRSGYQINDVLEVVTRRYRGLHNAEKRADHEVVIVAEREAEGVTDHSVTT